MDRWTTSDLAQVEIPDEFCKTEDGLVVPCVRITMHYWRAEDLATCLGKLSEINESLEGDRYEESELADTLRKAVQRVKDRREIDLLNLLTILVQFRDDCPDDEPLYADMLRAWRLANGGPATLEQYTKCLQDLGLTDEHAAAKAQSVLDDAVAVAAKHPELDSAELTEITDLEGRAFPPTVLIRFVCEELATPCDWPAEAVERCLGLEAERPNWSVVYAPGWADLPRPGYLARRRDANSRILYAEDPDDLRRLIVLEETRRTCAGENGQAH
jgi:hypothetical protein